MIQATAKDPTKQTYLDLAIKALDAWEKKTERRVPALWSERERIIRRINELKDQSTCAFK